MLTHAYCNYSLVMMVITREIINLLCHYFHLWLPSPLVNNYQYAFVNNRITSHYHRPHKSSKKMIKSSRHTKKSSTTLSEPDYSLSSDSGTEMAASARSPMVGSPLPPVPYLANYQSHQQRDGRVNRAYISSRTPSTSRYTVKNFWRQEVALFRKKRFALKLIA